MKITKEELQALRPIKNYCLVKITRKMDEIERGSLKLYYDKSYDDYKNAPVVGTIFKTPSKLTFDWHGVENETDMELQDGDQVYFKYLAYVNAMPGENENDHKYYEVDNDPAVYILIKYDSIFCIRRQNDEIYPINGYVICEPLDAEDKWHSDIIIQPQITNEIYKRSETFAKVVSIGSPIKKYRSPNVPLDDKNLKVGDVVAIDYACDIPLEVELHQTLPKTLFRVLRKDILGVLN